MIRIVMLATVAVAISAGAALAQDQQQSLPPNLEKVRQACAADIQRLCAGIQPGGGRLRQCIRSHKAELSSECQTALVAAKPVR